METQRHFIAELDIPEQWLDLKEKISNSEFGVVIRIRFKRNSKFSLKLAPVDKYGEKAGAICQKDRSM